MISNHGALEATKMWCGTRMPGSSSSTPSATSMIPGFFWLMNCSVEPQREQNVRSTPGDER